MLKRRRAGTSVRVKPEGGKITFRGKLSRMRSRLRHREWRHYGLLLLAGKGLGIAALFTLIASGTILYRAVAGDPIFAQAAAAPMTAESAMAAATSLINPVNTGWVLL